MSAALSCATSRYCAVDCSVARLAGDAHQAEDDLAAVLAAGVELGARLEVGLRAHVGGVPVLTGGGVKSAGRHRTGAGTGGAQDMFGQFGQSFDGTDGVT